jgi:hypothetical protein
MTPNEIDLHKRAIQQMALEEIRGADGYRLKLELDLGVLVALVSQCNLAFRHPLNTGASKETVQRLIHEIIDQLEIVDDLPRTAELLRLGEDPRFDESR